jgi:hypothetical protein
MLDLIIRTSLLAYVSLLGDAALTALFHLLTLLPSCTVSKCFLLSGRNIPVYVKGQHHTPR